MYGFLQYCRKYIFYVYSSFYFEDPVQDVLGMHAGLPPSPLPMTPLLQGASYKQVFLLKKYYSFSKRKHQKGPQLSQVFFSKRLPTNSVACCLPLSYFTDMISFSIECEIEIQVTVKNPISGFTQRSIFFNCRSVLKA